MKFTRLVVLLTLAALTFAICALAVLPADASGPPDPDTQKYYECRYHGPTAPDARTPGCVRFRPHRQAGPFRPRVWASMEESQ